MITVRNSLAIDIFLNFVILITLKIALTWRGYETFEILVFLETIVSYGNYS